MKRLIGPLAASMVLGLATHFGIVHYAPSFIMDRAYTMLGERGTAVHAFNLAPQMRPDTQSVVRPSPDLAYSACRFDLSAATNGVRVKMAAYDAYSSLSFFDAETNNFRTVRGEGEQREVFLFPPWLSDQTNAAPSKKGIILIRRLAPTDEDYARVVEAAKGDVCEAIKDKA
ncbi:DUF1254 domain-containing protein [Pontixanthobacter aestiaquae]|uniref:DUF1254 domain-containing protein n=1 Tax=Pontixanthobacter aestiaquae TaxID=1509367 RepID=A0A844Z3V3_9SPHN|nr:DUF1254 domain-containing protein [Pontixanthobacter aestiaquae]MDN3646405.1 DUF1254 domain-containing protein [Pontixanthobacter aestiaquae]MXO82605.1 DUF1254 domain-containing protein [Pontixanthobacter aestiaquae]